MPEDFRRQWKSLGFTHIDFGAVRVALTYHGRIGQPVVARTVFVTIFPNFNMSLHDPYLTEVLKIQRIQNHDKDVSLPGGQDSLFLNINAINGTTQCTQIPRQKPRKELVKVLLDTWATKYEKLRVHPQRFFFEEPKSTLPKNDILSHFPYKRPNQIVFPIHDGHGVQWFTYPFTGHTPWNIDCDCKGCQEGDLDDSDKSKNGKKCGNSEKEFKRRFDGGDPTIGSLSRPGNYEFLVSYKTQNE
ncbi:hypothetical protein KY285_000902 [Solanum tuberosum]|nr:hypothetical protein KY285_000902 [Solanum tuberosum]